MFYRLALTSGLMLASAIAMEQSALAQSVDVPFTGNVPVQATFSTPTPGTAEAKVSVSSGMNGNTFQSQTPATSAVQSTTPATITVSPPKFISGPTPDPSGTNQIGFLKFGSTNLRSDVGGGTGSLPAGSTNLQVDMLVQRPGNFTPGNYTYAVTLTITP
ncbi:MAG: hypothetical protein DSM106950_30410 [Stigonema ocellatum SAG 48.90 = DSM 106950]|nr:hypothetical protein [Stigonema ocellatum SAG 48.90 = DSM 106950]